jgi:hypothetical protein
MATFIKVVGKVVNYACIALILTSFITRILEFGKAGDPFFYIMTFYLLLFALFILSSEVGINKVMLYMQFLRGFIGRGTFIILIGLILYDEKRTVDMVVSIFLTVAGAFNIVIGCQREDDLDKEEEGDEEEGESEEEEIEEK